MKKVIIALFIFLMLFSFIVYAAETVTDNAASDKDISASQKANETASKINSALDKEVVIPDGLKEVARFVFGLQPDEKIDFKHFIILIAIWIGFFVLMVDIFIFVPFFNKGIVKFLGAAVVTCLVALSGGLKPIYIFFLDLGGFFGWFEKLWAPLKFLSVLFAIIFAAAVVILFSYISTMLRNKMEIAEAEQAGMEAGWGLKIMRLFLKNKR